MKKVLILLIVCAMFLAGCGKSNEGTEQPVVATQTTVAENDNLSEIDVFKDVKVEIDGKAPYATARLDKSNCDSIITSGVDFSLDKKEGLSNGDKITVTALVDYQYLANRGCKATITTKEIEVSGLDTYIVGANNEYDLSELEESLKKEASTATNIVGEAYSRKEFVHAPKEEEFNGEYNDFVARYYDYCWTLKNINYMPIKRYVLVSSNAVSKEHDVNRYIVMYEVTGTIEKTKENSDIGVDDYSVGESIDFKKYCFCQAGDVVVTEDNIIEYSFLDYFVVENLFEIESAESEMLGMIDPRKEYTSVEI